MNKEQDKKEYELLKKCNSKLKNFNTDNKTGVK